LGFWGEEEPLHAAEWLENCFHDLEQKG